MVSNWVPRPFHKIKGCNRVPRTEYKLIFCKNCFPSHLGFFSEVLISDFRYSFAHIGFVIWIWITVFPQTNKSELWFTIEYIFSHKNIRIHDYNFSFFVDSGLLLVIWQHCLYYNQQVCCELIKRWGMIIIKKNICDWS